MRPLGTRAWRKDGRRPARRAGEPCYYPPALRTVRQRAQDLVAEATAEAAEQARIDEAWDLPFLVFGLPGVTVKFIDEEENRDV